MTVKIKVPVKEVKENPNVTEIVLDTLKSDPKNAYTVSGMLIEKFGFKESDINNKPFSMWPKGAPTIYSRVRHALEKLKREGKVKSTKHEKAVVYWWSET